MRAGWCMRMGIWIGMGMLILPIWRSCWGCMGMFVSRYYP